MESLANGTTIDGDPSQPSFPVSVVVDETMQSKNNGTLFEKTDSTERLNVANGNGGVPNGNSHKGQLTASWLECSIYIRNSSVKGMDISYTLDSASVYQKVKPKISAVSPHNNRS